MSGIRIRKATVKDLPLLVDVVHAAFAEYQGKLDPPSGAHSESEGTLGQKLTKGGAVLAVAGRDVVGCALWSLEPAHLYLGRLGVLPAWRSRGVGGRLLGEVERLAVRLGFRRVQLGVRLGIPGLQSYYEKRGYKVFGHGTHQGYTRPTYAKMEKALD